MSIAGVYSNRGDVYQNLVALDWALTVLIDPDYVWLEIDSVSDSVDDVVIGILNGTQICCQCKKNQTNFKSWSISDLADELDKAFQQLTASKNNRVRFYSRDSFGSVAKLREYAATQPDKESYLAGLSDENKKTNDDLVERFSKKYPNFSIYEFIRRIVFETTNEIDRMESLLNERLDGLVSNPKAAYNALYTCLD